MVRYVKGHEFTIGSSPHRMCERCGMQEGIYNRWRRRCTWWRRLIHRRWQRRVDKWYGGFAA